MKRAYSVAKREYEKGSDFKVMRFPLQSPPSAPKARSFDPVIWTYRPLSCEAFATHGACQLRSIQLGLVSLLQPLLLSVCVYILFI